MVENGWQKMYHQESHRNGDILVAHARNRILDDDLLKRAQEYSGVSERTALLREALKALIEREAS